MVDFEVVELDGVGVDAPEAGDEAPDFTRPLVDEEFWENVSLSELYDDGPVLLVFHPMDGAFPATYVWNEIRDREWEGRAVGGGDLRVIGISISSPYEHKTFIEEREIASRLFSDPGAGVAEAYGIDWELDGMAGIREPLPAAFLIEDGTVRHAWVAEEWPDFPPYDEIESAIDDL